MRTLQMTAKNLASIGFLALLAIASASGQTGTALKAKVPFAFEAGAATFPAGTYQFKFEFPEQNLVISGDQIGEKKLHIMAQLAGASL